MASELEVGKVKSVSGTQTAELSGGELTLKRGSSTPTYINFPDSGASLQLRGPSYATALTIDSSGLTTLTAGSNSVDDETLKLAFDLSGTSKVMGSIGTTNVDASNGGLTFKTVNSGTLTERLSISSTGLCSFSNGITVSGANNWSHISAKDTQSVSIADDAQIQLADNEAGSMLIHVYDRGTGYGGLIFVSYAGAPVIVADPSGVFAVSDTDNKYCVISSSSSHDVYFKNRSGVTRQFCILVTAGVLDNF